MRTNSKFILHRLLSLAMALVMAGSLLATPAMAADEHDHTLEYNLDDLIADYTVPEDCDDCGEAHDCSTGVGCTYDVDGHMNCTEAYALKVDPTYFHECGDGHCTYDADGVMNCGTFYPNSSCGCGAEATGTTAVAEGGCCDTAEAEEPSFFAKTVSAIAGFFDMSDVSVTAYAACIRPSDCRCSDCSKGCWSSTGPSGNYCFNTPISSGDGDGGSSGGTGNPVTPSYTCPSCSASVSSTYAHRKTCSTCSKTYYSCAGSHTCQVVNNVTNNYYTKCPFCGSTSTHNSQCPTVAAWVKNTCAFCRSTTHTMQNCPEYKKTLGTMTNVDTCDVCGVTVGATINGVDWVFPHEADCTSLKPQTTTNYEVRDDGVYIGGVKVPGTGPLNYNTTPQTPIDTTQYDNRVSSVSTGEAVVLTYPRTLSDLVNCVGTNFYDDANWKTIIRARGSASYAANSSGIWTYSGSKYRIAKVPQATDAREYVLVRLPSDWDSRLNETNPRPFTGAPVGTTTYETRTVTSTSTSNPKSNNGSASYDFGGGVTQTAKPGTGYNSNLSGGYNAGARVGSDGKPVGNNKYSDGKGNTYSFVTGKDGKPEKDNDGNYKIKKTSSSTSEVSVPVHVCSYSTSYSHSCGGNHEGASQHTATTTSCCGSSSSVQQAHTYSTTTYTDMGPDIHRVEQICSLCGHIQVSYASHPAATETCPSCKRPMGKHIQWHWYNSAEGPVITSIWQPYYSILKYPATRGRQDYVFTGWYTDWGGVGQKLDPDTETLYVHVMPSDFYAAWAFIIQHDFTAPTISTTFFATEAEAKKANGKPITDMSKPVEELWVRIDTIDLEGHLVEAHKSYVGQSSTKDKLGTAHYQWHQDNPLWTSGLIPDIEDWVGSLQLSGEGDTWHESPYIVKVTRNEPLTVIARDAWANTRSHTITITNFDDGAPVVEGFTQSNTGWTNQPVRVNVIAYDDQELAPQAYKWDYTLNSEGNLIVHPGTWTASSYFDMPDAGLVRVTVKDAVGKETKSGQDVVTGSTPTDWYAVSNIDKIPLALSSSKPYNVSEENPIAAVTGVTITLNIVDPTDPVTGMSSGLAPTAIKWEGLTDWTTAKSITVHANGTYTVQLRDAVGNTASYDITISNIVTNGPSVSLSGTDVDGHSITSETWWKGPVTLNAFASMGEAGARTDGMTYSWDGGNTWTTQSTYVCTTNGTYTVTVRDSSGTTASSTIYLGHLDNTAPVAGMYLYKGQPDDWNDRFPGKTCTEADYVWKIRIEIEDPGSTLTEGNPSIGSGLYSIQYQWIGNRVVLMDNVTTADRDALGGTVTSSTTHYTHIFDVPQPGSYQITVYDRAGNAVQVEKVAQWTDLGESVDGPNPNVPITLPDTGGGPSGTDDTQRGTAGLPYDANIEDLIFGEDGVYDTRPTPPGHGYTPYPSGQEGIPINFQAEITRNRWGTGYVTYNGIKYTVTFSNPDSNGLNTTLGSFGSVANAKVLGTGNKINCYAFIPISAFHTDVKNARIYVTINEWDDEACTQLLKTGTENLYTSVQKTHPTITYTYNRVTDTMTVVATSALSGIKKVEYQYDSSGWVDYTGPFVIGEPKPTTITLKATDNLGYETELVINVADLGLNGSTGGVGSLPQDTLTGDGATSSYHSSNRAADIYIIGGTRGNTDQCPSGTVFDRLLG